MAYLKAWSPEGEKIIKDYGAREGYICRIVKEEVKCRLAPEQEMQSGKDYMILRDEGHIWGLDADGLSDLLSYYEGQLLYDHPDRFPEPIREKFNEIMFMLDSLDILHNEKEWTDIRELEAEYGRKDYEEEQHALWYG